MHRVHRIRLLADAVRRLGPAWALFRFRYFVRRRAGRLRAASPRLRWPAVAAISDWPTVVDSDSLSAELGESMTTARRALLEQRCAQLSNFTFEVFGEQTELTGWHDDPTVDGQYATDLHWSDVSTPEGADVKRVWEPSRFTWAFDLARLHLVAPDTGAADVFWRLLDDWMEHNPPNTGVNWACGQESSFRLLSVIAAADAMTDTLTAYRRRQVRQLAVATADRVAMNIDYARSQANNHHASEAMGLVMSGLLFADEPNSTEWLRIGERHLAEVCDVLVFDDGGTSQYATNYHRVFVHDFVWTAQVYRAVGRAVPTWLQSAGERATRFLAAIVEPISGSGPFFGPDDGARVLPLSPSAHRHLADDVALGAACFGVDVATTGSSEPAAWFGLEQRPVCSVPATGGAYVESFPEMGLHILGCGALRVYVRATQWTFRPAHDDQLHCDIWIDGDNIVRDPGTATYHPRPGQPGPLSAADVHNGPRLVGRIGMAKASKFLWAQWTQARVVSLDVVDGRAVGRFVHDIDGVEVTRVVEVGDSVSISDSSELAFETSWLVDEPFVSAVSFDGDVREGVGVAAGHYGSAEPAVYRSTRSVTTGASDRLHTVVARPVSR